MGSQRDIIVAPATLTGGAIAIVRLSGEGCVELCSEIFRPRSKALKTLCDAASHTLNYGEIVEEGRVIDDVLVSVFRAPHSYTGEESVEISCHGSQYIVQEIIELAIDRGAHAAEAGEFTTRAYLAGRMDLSQAEAVADMIASSSRAQHAMASTQMRGEYSSRLSGLRGGLVHIAALLELELDFGEEEVEFADRTTLLSLMESLKGEIERLADSFSVGNAIKNGVPVAIIGEPNVGKSTLLNAILGDNRAMVSEIAGTTRDVIEEQVTIEGVTFRFIDTAGLHTTDDKLEKMGIERTYQAAQKAQILIHLTEPGERANTLEIGEITQGKQVINVVNKIDLKPAAQPNGQQLYISAKEGVGIDAAEQPTDQQLYISAKEGQGIDPATQPADQQLYISAKEGVGIEELLQKLRSMVETKALFEGAPIVSNTRHYELLKRSLAALNAAKEGIKTDLPTDLLCQEIKEVLHNIGEITGEITTNDILGEIFSKFCIGK